MSELAQTFGGLAVDGHRHRRWSVVLSQGWFLFYRDFQWVYSLTFLGYFWSVVRPLASALPLVFIGNEFQIGSGKGPVPYFVWAFTGFVLWNVFWDCVVQPTNLLYRSRTILRRMPLDGRAIMIASVISVLFHLLINVCVMAIAVLIAGVPVSSKVFLLLGTVPFLGLAGLSFGLPFASIGVLYQDIRYGIGFLGNVLLWSAPILHEMPESGKLHFINLWNPLTYLIDMSRYLTYGLAYPLQREFWLACSVALGAFYLGYRFYLKKLPMGFDYVV